MKQFINRLVKPIRLFPKILLYIGLFFCFYSAFDRSQRGHDQLYGYIEFGLVMVGIAIALHLLLGPKPKRTMESGDTFEDKHQ